MLTTFAKQQPKFKISGVALMTNFINGLNSKTRSITTTMTAGVSKAVAGAKSYYKEVKTAGKYVVQGFANGIKNNTYLAEARSREMASSAAKAAKRELQEKSPSRVFFDIGDNAGLGFVNALENYASISYSIGHQYIFKHCKFW